MPEPGMPVIQSVAKKLRMDDGDGEMEEDHHDPDGPPKEEELLTFPTDDETRTPSREAKSTASSSKDGNTVENNGANTKVPNTPDGKTEGDEAEWAHVEEATIAGDPVPQKTAAKHPHSSVPVEPQLFALISKYMNKHANEAKPLTVALEGINDSATREMMAGTLLHKIQSLDPAEYDAVVPTEDDQLHARKLWVSTKEGAAVTQQWHLDQADAKDKAKAAAKEKEAEEEKEEEAKEAVDLTNEIDFDARAVRKAQRQFRPGKLTDESPMPIRKHGDQPSHVTKASAKALANAVALADKANANDDKKTLELRACQGLLSAHEERFANNTRHTQYLECQLRSMQDKEAKSKAFVKGFTDNAMNARTREDLCRSLFESLGAETRDIVDVNPWEWNGRLGRECLVQFRNGPVKEYWLSAFFRKYGKNGVWNDDHQLTIFVQPFEAQTRLDKLKVWRTVLTVVGSYCEAIGDTEGLSEMVKIWTFPQKLIYGEGKDDKVAVLVDWDERPGTCVVYTDDIHYEVMCKEFPVAFFEKFCNKRQWEEYIEAENNKDGETMTQLEDAVMNRYPWPIHFVQTTFEGTVNEFRKSKEESKGSGGGKSDKGGGKSKGKGKDKGKGRKGGGDKGGEKGGGKSQAKSDAWGANWYNEETEDEKKRREEYQQQLRGGSLPQPAEVPQAAKTEPEEEEATDDAWGKYKYTGGESSRRNPPYSKPWNKEEKWSKHTQYDDYGHEEHGGQSSEARSSRRRSYKR